MYGKRLAFGPLVICILFWLGGCSGGDNGTGSGGEKEAVRTPTVQEIIPPPAMHISSNIGAIQTEKYIGLINSFTDYDSYFTPPSGTPKFAAMNYGLADTALYTWTAGQMDIAMTYRSSLDRYSWSVILNGSDPDNGYIYSDWEFIEAEELLDGAEGEMTVIENPEEPLQALHWSWTIESGTYTITRTGPLFQVIVCAINGDGSGSLDYKHDVNPAPVVKFTAVWDADGSGSWYNYVTGEAGTW